MNFAKLALKTAALALSATVLLTACGKTEESNGSQPADDPAAVDSTASGGAENEQSIDIVEQKISLGSEHSAVITDDGSLYLWGSNEYGQLGTGTKGDGLTPIKVMDHVKAVSLGAFHSAAITEDGSLYLWGNNEYVQIGSEENKRERKVTTPVKIMDRVKSVSLGRYHSAAITEDGSLYTWGYNKFGLLGNGTEKSSEIPVKIMDHVKSVCLGFDHSSAITEDGSLYMWGSNEFGELGNGEYGFDGAQKRFSNTPIKIMDNVKAASLGEFCSAAITENGDLYTWGNTPRGRLGRSDTENNILPVKIMDKVKAISIKFDHGAAIKEDGSLYLWGFNEYGQLGNGEEKNSTEPVKVMDHVKDVALGYTHSAAITEDGSLYTWGSNYDGELGNGKEGKDEGSSTPIKIELPGDLG